MLSGLRGALTLAAVQLLQSGLRLGCRHGRAGDGEQVPQLVLRKVAELDPFLSAAPREAALEDLGARQ